MSELMPRTRASTALADMDGAHATIVLRDAHERLAREIPRGAPDVPGAEMDGPPAREHALLAQIRQHETCECYMFAATVVAFGLVCVYVMVCHASL